MVRETNREARRRARCDQALDVQTRDMFDTVAPVGRPCPSSDPVDSRFRNSHATCEVNKRGQVRKRSRTSMPSIRSMPCEASAKPRPTTSSSPTLAVSFDDRPGHVSQKVSLWPSKERRRRNVSHIQRSRPAMASSAGAVPSSSSSERVNRVAAALSPFRCATTPKMLRASLSPSSLSTLSPSASASEERAMA